MNQGAGLLQTTSCVGMCALLLCVPPARGQQPDPATAASREALDLCRAADDAPLSERSAVLANGLDRAAKAVQEDPRDAVAHFAVFCTLGKRLRMEQHLLRLLAALPELDRARRELDVALTLAPDYAGALAAKGEMLAELPGFLGGDRQEGERLLRRAVALDPDDPHLRMMLANLLRDEVRRPRGRSEERRGDRRVRRQPCHAERAAAMNPTSATLGALDQDPLY